MRRHGAVLEAGPGTVRELTCREPAFIDPEQVAAALDGIDDPVALVDDRPVAVDRLWRAVLRSAGGRDPSRLIVVHPSWWAPSRVETIGSAADAVADDVVLRPRSWLLALATPPAAVIVEIAERIVVITGTSTVAEPRDHELQAVAEAVLGAIAALAPDPGVAVVIDVPVGVVGAGELAEAVAELLRRNAFRTVVLVDDTRLRRLAAAAATTEQHSKPPPAQRPRRRHGVLLLPAVVIAAGIWAHPFGRQGAPAADGMTTTFLVEGRVAVEIPANWPAQRVPAGPGSARVQVTSPSDPALALHITQSPVADQTLADAAESLKNAIDAEPPGVFVDLNPAGVVADRPAVTYRELRAGHDVRWAVLLERALRIGIGCQSRPGDYDAVRAACELAVRSARALD
jgi:type VII secretion-associated protein (TIGR03931 family)